jgi:dienelactone hydrolase
VIHGVSAMTMCIRHEFECFATSRTSRISHWLRALCARMKAECGGRGVGAIGMCFTGSVILAVMLEEALLVPVLSQPAMPFHEGFLPGGPSSDERKRALGIHPSDLRAVVARAADTPILGYRFTTDRICPKERFETLRQTFGENFSGAEIPTGSGDRWNIKDGAHSVLTKYFVDQPDHPTRKALDEILGRFAQRLH